MTSNPGTAVPSLSAICPWCGQPFALPRVTHGERQKFCRPACRAAFWKAAWRWVANAVVCGLLTTDAIKGGGAAVYGSGGADVLRVVGEK